jgi:prevent-host-death family protein
MRNKWQLQEAKNQLSRVVDNALNEGAQVITRHGEPAVVVLSMAGYNKLRSGRKSLVEILRSCPVSDFRPAPLRDTPHSRPL